MTRGEALKRLNHVDDCNKPINNAEKNYVLFRKLEALGLIKFEEEKKMYNVIVDEASAHNFRMQGYLVEKRK